MLGCMAKRVTVVRWQAAGPPLEQKLERASRVRHLPGVPAH